MITKGTTLSVDIIIQTLWQPDFTLSSVFCVIDKIKFVSTKTEPMSDQVDRDYLGVLFTSLPLLSPAVSPTVLSQGMLLST